MSKADFIKAKLDLLKIVISALVIAMLGIGVYYFQTQKPNPLTAIVAILAIFIVLYVSVIKYLNYANELKNDC